MILFYFRMMMIRILSILFTALMSVSLWGQPPQSMSAAQILQHIRKLKVLGSVLYIAAHPDDENTRLITYLANHKLYRTGYLSLTRGDGGQNLIGNEQGAELGLIRTQELLAARRIDGGEQFFTRAYDFGFSKNPKETFSKWGRENILSDVVWVIRNFQPDVIITRFPVTGEGGHGHHTASAILANEAFKAAADPNRFKEQLQYVQPWQAKRILWNTFDFGEQSTTHPSQFHINVGGYNALLGTSYGQIAALSRSQHKSQGFGSSGTTGDNFEYFKNTGGKAPANNLLDDVDTSWNRIDGAGRAIQSKIEEIERSFAVTAPQKSVPALVDLYKKLEKEEGDWARNKKQEVQELIAQCSGLYIDAYTTQAYAVQNEKITFDFTIHNRQGADMILKSISIANTNADLNKVLSINKTVTYTKTVTTSEPITQPYWLKEKMDEDVYHVSDQKTIGRADVFPAYSARVGIIINGKEFFFEKPVQYKFIDPVKGEVYQPLPVMPRAVLTVTPNLLILSKSDSGSRKIQTHLHAFAPLKGNVDAGLRGVGKYSGVQNRKTDMQAGQTAVYHFQLSNTPSGNEKSAALPYVHKTGVKDSSGYHLAFRKIDYSHIPAIHYFYSDQLTVLNIDLKKAGRKIGYIAGAGDKVPHVLEQMGYQVTMLDQAALAVTDLKAFDAIITGVRAYNTNSWMVDFYDDLMNYIKEGGNLIVQYNTSNNIGSVTSKIGPYHFNITRNRVADEAAKVKMLDPNHKVFHFPNKITEKDFEQWIQERSQYHAANWDSKLVPLLSMADSGESSDNGSLLIGKYGKGYFTYMGLVLYRELPAAVPGALRLMANLIGLNQEQAGEF